MKSGLSIYDPIAVGHPTLWIPAADLEAILDDGLRGLSLAGLPLRTRSKVVKASVCRALGYPVPKSFKKSQPRFTGQCFDTYAQKSNNLQIWNEDVDPKRRYVILRVSEDDVVTRVRVISGEDLAQLDTTGTLTQKYQARLILGASVSELITPSDTDRLADLVRSDIGDWTPDLLPVSYPMATKLMSIGAIFERLKMLVGSSFPDRGIDQERNRGADLHRAVCGALGYTGYQDDGRFPDVRNQLLEVKLQTSSTIDLGLVRPDDVGILDIPQLNGREVRHCDVRYALFYAETDGSVVRLTHFFLTNGTGFFSRFPQFQGRVVNRKLQIPLPSTFFKN